uniref:AAA+ ATPase domain-containing protein n=1 Tax=Chenopodium quinoa TaxID=63459 RepID=A0A803LSW6_CHEQI
MGSKVAAVSDAWVNGKMPEIRSNHTITAARNLRVSDLIDQNTMSWNGVEIAKWFEERDAKEIIALELPDSEQQDRQYWKHTPNATMMFVKAMYEQYLPHQWRDSIRSFMYRYTERIVRFFSPYLHITFEEYTGERFSRSEAYITIQTYLSEKTSDKARGLKGNFVKDGKALVLGLADNEEVTDVYQGVKVWWTSHKSFAKSQTITFYPGMDEKRHYQLTFHGSNRKFVTETYLNYILVEGKAITIKNRQRKLFTNVKEKSGSYYSRGSLWSHVEFKHPASFETLGMEETKKNAIKNDLLRFRSAKDYYNKIGKPWKRGYLLYGPPGTGKSTMIVAIANLLEYDIYDLELTAVKDNTTLRQLLIETSGKSIVVIEDIDWLLNFIDGIWSAIGEERLIIFTTNHFEKLDQALIRRGRMDVHIELSYCCFESFKMLANNYLDVKSHRLFDTIKGLLEETKMNPADVAESLMPKSLELDVD